MNTNSPCRRLLLNGAWVEVSSLFPIVNPYSGETIATVALGDAALLNRALTSCQNAFAITRHQPPHERSALLHRVAAGLEIRKRDFAETLCAEAGKPITLAEAEVDRSINTFLAAAEAARSSTGDFLNLDGFAAGQGHIGITRRFPIGIIAGITPFNFPLNLVAHKVAPCLATGNTLLLKPALKTPLCALLLGEVLTDAGMTPGQVNIITCSNEDASALVSDERIAMVSFTGSSDVGWKLKSQCRHKKTTLELGGNAGVLLDETADIPAAVPLIAAGAFGYAGQSCISVQRIFVHRQHYAAFRSAFVEHVRSRIHTGDPQRREVTVGPMINSDARERIAGWIQTAIQAGASVLTGGQGQGNCLEATILENVPPHHPLCAQEAFAPVAILSPCESFEEGLALLNDSVYGLQAGVFTREITRAWQAFQHLDVGGVLINQAPTWRVENMPYGGVKESGLGREGVRYAMEEMTELKSWIVKTA